MVENKDSFETLYKSAEALICIKKYGDALTLYRKVVEDMPDLAGGWHGLAICYEEIGNKEKSLESYQKALQLHMNDAGNTTGRARKALLWGGWCAIKLDKNQIALEMMEKAVEEDPYYAYSYLSLAVASARAGKKDEAYRAKKKYLDLVGKTPYERRECEGWKMLIEAEKEASDWLKSYISSIMTGTMENWQNIANPTSKYDKNQFLLHINGML
ncbi:MAG: tetratricopeptide repeat protein [Thermoplasmata archaeon]